MLASRGLHFFYGGRGEADFFAPQLLDFLPASARFTAALSAPAEGARGPTGFLHAVVRGALGEALRDREIYFAGPAAMSAAIRKMAHEASVPQGQLHFDEFF